MKILTYILSITIVLLSIPAKAINTKASYNKYVCEGTNEITLRITQPNPELRYIWIVNNKAATIINSSGIDSTWVTIKWPVTNVNVLEKVSVLAKETGPDGCQTPDTMIKMVEFKPKPSPQIIVPEGSQCEGDRVELTVGNISSSMVTYKWNNITEFNKDTFSTYVSGNVNVEVIQEYILPNNDSLKCSGSQGKLITFKPLPTISLEDSIQVCGDKNYRIVPGYDAGKPNIFEWVNKFYNGKEEVSNGSYLEINSNTQSVLLKITDNESKCESSAYTVIYCPEIDTIQAISMGFSPNGDGFNDAWELQILDKYPGSTVEVYDRWGNLVFMSDPTGYKPWDGTKEGVDLPMDTYYYLLNIVDPDKELRYKNKKYTLPEGTLYKGNRSFSKVGTVVIIR